MLATEGFYIMLNDKITQPSLGEQLKYYRMHLQVSQAELAKRMGKQQPFVAKMENGKQRLYIDLITMYLSALGCAVSLSGIDLPSQQRIIDAHNKVKKQSLTPMDKALPASANGIEELI